MIFYIKKWIALVLSFMAMQSLGQIPVNPKNMVPAKKAPATQMGNPKSNQNNSKSNSKNKKTRTKSSKGSKSKRSSLFGDRIKFLGLGSMFTKKDKVNKVPVMPNMYNQIQPEKTDVEKKSTEEDTNNGWFSW